MIEILIAFLIFLIIEAVIFTIGYSIIQLFKLDNVNLKSSWTTFFLSLCLGVTVNIIQTLADNHGIYVLYEVEIPEEIKPNVNIGWEKQKLKIQYENPNKEVGSGGGYAYSKVIGTDKNKYTMLHIRTGAGEVKNQRLSFELEGLKKVYMFPNEDRAEYEKYLDCKFCFEWDFEYNKAGKRFNVNIAKTQISDTGE